MRKLALLHLTQHAGAVVVRMAENQVATHRFRDPGGLWIMTAGGGNETGIWLVGHTNQPPPLGYGENVRIERDHFVAHGLQRIAGLYQLGTLSESVPDFLPERFG